MLGIIADDLTGAGDASVQFAKRGWRTLLMLVTQVEERVVSGFSRTTVLAVTTDCRALSNEAAEELTAAALT